MGGCVWWGLSIVLGVVAGNLLGDAWHLAPIQKDVLCGICNCAIYATGKMVVV